MKSSRELVEAARAEIPELDAEELKHKLDHQEEFTLIDVRDDDEYRAGYVPSALHLSRGMVEFSIADRVMDFSREIVLYCAGGFRSLLAAQSLKTMGYENVISMTGGYRAWANSGYPITKPIAMSHDQLERYSRHFMLREVGEEGQVKLLRSKVLLIGAGGLGSPAGVYLAAAGVGTLGIVDSDRVDLSNLQRQILHSTPDVDKLKVDSAIEAINAMNPDVNVVAHPIRLNETNIIDIFEEYDLVVDGTDNFATRYLINDAAVLLNKTIVHGSIFQFEGQLTVFKPEDGPCYRCMFPDPPPPGLVPS